MGTYVPPFGPQNFIDKKGPVVGSAWLNAIDQILQGQGVPAAGTYLPQFLSGEVQVTGPGGLITSYGDFGYSLSSPGPAGTPGPFLRVAGAGKAFGQIGTDAQIPGLNGINLFIAAGDSDASGVTNGGTLALFGGGSLGGMGGAVVIQAGTSVNGSGGNLNLFGGNATNAQGPAGNIFILAGTEGNSGGSIKMYATNLNGNAGDISFWLGQPDIPHSVPLWTMSHTGALFPGNQGAGTPADLVNGIPASVLVTGGNLAAPTWGQQGLVSNCLLTLSGALNPVLSTIASYITDGNFVQLWIGPGATASNPTGPNDLILSTLPVGLRPTSPKRVPVFGLINGGATGICGQAIVDTLGGITISVLAMTAQGLQAVPNTWSLSGIKGVDSNFTMMYALNGQV